MNDDLRFFATHGPITRPGNLASLFDDLPGDVASLARVVQGLVLHIFWAERYGVSHAPERKTEVQLRYVERQLKRIRELDPRPLAETRTPEARLVGNCRDFSVLLTAMLRHKGIPARARCGFASYFEPDFGVDHWVCEYWNDTEGRWILVDAQLDAFQVGALRVGFDPLDVPRTEFLVGGRVWELCRTAQADPEKFGIFDMKGMWFIRGDFVRDVAALNKVELLPWDAWGAMNRRDVDLTEADLAELDRLAALTAGDVPELAEVRRSYEADPRWRVPPTIQSYVDGVAQSVTLTL